MTLHVKQSSAWARRKGSNPSPPSAAKPAPPPNPPPTARARPIPKRDLFPDLCVVSLLPRPVAEYRFHDLRRWRFDYAWPDWKIALEVEGGVWTGGRHTRGAGYLGDCEKYNEAQLLGWIVLRCTPSQLRTKGIALLQRAMKVRMP